MKTQTTEQIDIIQGNKLIAEFMGAELEGTMKGKLVYGIKGPCSGKTDFYYPSELKYHASWDWLMPVVEKIKELMYDQDMNVKGSLGNKIKYVTLYTAIFESFQQVDINKTYTAVVEFIKWSNEQ